MPTNNPYCTKGWVPGSVDVPASPLEHGAKLVAATVGDLYADKPISGAAVARTLDRDTRTVRRWLDQAKSMRLIKQPKSKRGWIPA
ncbi:MAG: hypothetical protein AAFU85_08395 [Planctomycetota bacterium]